MSYSWRFMGCCFCCRQPTLPGGPWGNVSKVPAVGGPFFPLSDWGGGVLNSLGLGKWSKATQSTHPKTSCTTSEGLGPQTGNISSVVEHSHFVHACASRHFSKWHLKNTEKQNPHVKEPDWVSQATESTWPVWPSPGTRSRHLLQPGSHTCRKSTCPATKLCCWYTQSHHRTLNSSKTLPPPKLIGLQGDPHTNTCPGQCHLPTYLHTKRTVVDGESSH